MKKELLNFFMLLRSIFGVCPRSGEFFRLSDCRIYLKRRPAPDWMDQLESKEIYLDSLEERFSLRESALRTKAREQGRELANQMVRKLDTIFKPLKLNPDDSKVIFHPVDYIVFKGMKVAYNPYHPERRIEGPIKGITFLDRKAQSKEHQKIQNSVEKVIEQGKYDWQTLRILEDGTIKIE